MGLKKYLVLGILFILPITVYLFFASGVNQFAKLPKLGDADLVLTGFVDSEGSALSTKEKITILGFFGGNVLDHKAELFNLAHKIYKKNYLFEDFQMVFLATKDQDSAVVALKEEFSQIADPVNFKVGFGAMSDINRVHSQLSSPHALNQDGSTSFVYIIDRDAKLRGRQDIDQQEFGVGYNAANYATVNNEMNDDIKVILAEYRLALKKYQTSRKK